MRRERVFLRMCLYDQVLYDIRHAFKLSMSPMLLLCMPKHNFIIFIFILCNLFDVTLCMNICMNIQISFVWICIFFHLLILFTLMICFSPICIQYAMATKNGIIEECTCCWGPCNFQQLISCIALKNCSQTFFWLLQRITITNRNVPWW